MSMTYEKKVIAPPFFQKSTVSSYSTAHVPAVWDILETVLYLEATPSSFINCF